MLAGVILQFFNNGFFFMKEGVITPLNLSKIQLQLRFTNDEGVMLHLFGCVKIKVNFNLFI